MNNKFIFAFVIVLASLSIGFGLMAEVVHYREGRGLHIGHIARAFTIPLLVIVISLLHRTRSRPK